MVRRTEPRNRSRKAGRADDQEYRSPPFLRLRDGMANPQHQQRRHDADQKHVRGSLASMKFGPQASMTPKIEPVAAPPPSTAASGAARSRKGARRRPPVAPMPSAARKRSRSCPQVCAK